MCKKFAAYIIVSATEAPRCMTQTRRWSGGDCIPTGTVGTSSASAGRRRQDADPSRVAAKNDQGKIFICSVTKKSD
jgi:hypothetical protein